MLTDEEYISQSLQLNLLYCESMLEFTFSLQFSFLDKDTDIINIIKSFDKRFRDQINIVIELANNKVSKEFLDSHLLYTEYTLPLYNLNEELLGVKSSTDIIKKIMELQPGTTVVTEDLINRINQINNDTINLLNDYIDFVNYLHSEVIKVNLFVFKYGMYIDDIKSKATYYSRNLTDLINKKDVFILDISNSDYYLKRLMEKNALFINGFVNQSEDSIITTARNFGYEFNTLELERIPELSVDEQKKVYNQAYTLINYFIQFITSIIKRILNRNLQFMVGSVYLDVCLREAYSFKYSLINSFDFEP